MSNYPQTRLRRLRQHPQLRRSTQAVRLEPAHFVLPLFVRSGQNVRRDIASMPGVQQLSIDQAVVEAREAQELGVAGVILFGIPDEKDATGAESCNADSIVPQAVRAIKQAATELLVATDVCLCEYTSHGHCGPVDDHTGRVDVNNDATLELLAKQALVHAKSGADLLAPSGMMDGMVGAIRQSLDRAGYSHLPILSYAAKYASAFYGPFREAAESAPQFGDRRSYQMDPAADPAQALREVEQDLEQGADLIMVKPALAYLDILQRVSQRFPGVPLAAYNVSGEYSLVKAAAAQGWLDERQVALESLLAIRRAGASLILTYWAKQAAGWLAGS